MEWSRNDVEGLYEAQQNATRSLMINDTTESSESDALRAVATRAVELVAARGGTMTDRQSAEWARMVKEDQFLQVVQAQAVALRNRLAVLEAEKSNLEDANRLLNERRVAAEEGNRDLVRRAQQAEGKLAELSRDCERAFVNAKTYLRRAEEAEARCAPLSATGTHASEAGDLLATWGSPADVSRVLKATGHGAAVATRYPCSATCTHDDARTPGHPERVKDRSAMVTNAVAAGKAVVSEAYEHGAEAMRAACWRDVAKALEREGYYGAETPAEGTLSFIIKAAIEGATP